MKEEQEYNIAELMRQAEEDLAEDLKQNGNNKPRNPFMMRPQEMWEFRSQCLREAKDYFHGSTIDKEGNRHYPSVDPEELVRQAGILYRYYLLGK